MKKFLAKAYGEVRLYPLYSAVLTVFCLIIGHILNNSILGKNTGLIGDSFAQYVPFIEMFMRVLRGEQDFWYSFSIYLGSNTSLTYAYYTLSPFNLFFLIPGIPVYAIYLFVSTLKLGCAAAAFEFYAIRAHHRRDPLPILFSVLYATSAYLSLYYFHIMWLDAFFMIPLIVIAIDTFVKTGKYYGLILSYLYLFITNFYMGFMVGILTALLFLCMIFLSIKKDDTGILRKTIKKCLGFAGCVLLAAGISAAILLPAGYYLLSTLAVDNSTFSELTVTLPDLLSTFFMGKSTYLNNSTPLLYCGLPVLLLLPFYFFIPKISLKEKICASLLLIVYFTSMLWLPLYKFMHAFDFPNYYNFRYAFCLIFILISIAMRASEYLEDVRFKQLTAYGLILILFYSFTITLQSVLLINDGPISTNNGMLINALFITAILLLFRFGKKICKRFLPLAVTFLVCAEVITNYYLNLQIISTPVSKDFFNQWYYQEKQTVETIRAKDPGFYRISSDNEVCLNAAAMFDYNGLTTFSSSDNYFLRHALSSLGISTSNRAIQEQGYTDLTKALFSVKYQMNLADPEKAENINPQDITSAEIVEDPNILPLGFMAGNSILDYTFTDDPFLNQESLINAFTNGNYHFYESISANDIKEEGTNVQKQKIDDLINYHMISDSIENGIYTYSIPRKEGKEIQGIFLPTSISAYTNTSPVIAVKGKGYKAHYELSCSAIITADPEPATTLYNIDPASYDHISVCLGKSLGGDYTIKEELFYYYDGSELEAVCEDIKQQSFEIKEFSDSKITGTVTATEDRPILFTTIPYEKGWNAIVDGKGGVLASPLEGAFLGLVLTPGEHEIVLEYNAPLALEGSIISGFSLMILCVLILHSYRSKKKAAVPVSSE